MFPEASTSESEKGKVTESRISSLASLLHEEWRKSRWRKDTQDFEPRIKKTKDEVWSQWHQSATEVDIANTEYDSLPEDWKIENKKSAEVAIAEVERAIHDAVSLDEQFVEYASSILHDKWLDRNVSGSNFSQNVPYSELSEEEKDKDRVIIRKAIEVCSNGQIE